MTDYVEWQNADTGEVERATVSGITESEGVISIDFSRTALWLEGRLALLAVSGRQRTTGQMYFRDGAYHGEASIVGDFARTAAGIEFVGFWRDWRDKDANTFYLFVEASLQQQAGQSPPAPDWRSD